VSSWIDESLLLSELSGALLLLVIAWIIVLKNQLWQRWLRQNYQGALQQLAGELQLRPRSGWRARLELRGRQGPVKVSVQWRAGVGPHRLLVKARRGLRRRKWIGRPDTPPAELRQQVERLVAGLSG